MARGQVSAEMMMLFLIFLALLAISFSAMTNAGRSSQERVGKAVFESSFADFSSKVKSACELGNGNVRSFELPQGEASVSSSGTEFTFSMYGESRSASSFCDTKILQEDPSGEFTISNVDGTIEIS